MMVGGNVKPAKSYYVTNTINFLRNLRELNMNKLFILFFIAPAITFADNNFNDSLPKPDGGLKIVKSSSLQLNDELKKENEEYNLKGYITRNTDLPKQMLLMGQKGYTYNDNYNEPDDTHMKKELSKIKLAFLYKPISSHAIGFAPIGGYEKGWTGVKEYFKSDVGICSYSVLHLHLTHGAINIDADSVKHDVNGKVTTIDVEGNVKDGFTYQISWYDSPKLTEHELECANANFDKAITAQTIKLAQQIDKKQNS